MPPRPQRAFSLVEISIVIVIIGILIAGISKGMDLYADFKLTTARNLTNNSIVNRIQGLTIWLESTSTKSFAKAEMSNNEAIALWNDINPQRPMKINVTQATENKRPTYVKNAINNLPALKFANNLELRSVDIFTNDFISTDEATIFLVQNNFSGDDRTVTLSWIPTTNNTDSGEITRFNICAQEANKISVDFTAGANGRTSTPTLTNFLNQNKIITYLKNGANTNIRLNFNEINTSSSTTSGIIPTNLMAPFIVGKFRTDNNYFFNGYVGEIIIFNRALRESERYEVEKYLSQKWAIKIG